MDKRRKLNLRRSTRSAGGTNWKTEVSGNNNPGESQSSKSRETTTTSQYGNDNHRLNWNLQSSHILKELGKLYYCNEQEPNNTKMDTTDVTLFSSEGHCVSAHKIVLMLGSPYFQKLFLEVSKTKRNERDGAIVVLGNVKTVHLQNLIHLIYTGGVNVSSKKESEEFHDIIKQFQIEGVSSSGSTTDGTSSTKTNTTSSDSIKRGRGRPPSSSKAVLKVSEQRSKPNLTNQEDLSLLSEDDDVHQVEGESTINKSVSEVLKVEPNEEETNIYDDGGSGDDFMEQDAGSNFSDEIRGDDDVMLSEENDEDDDDKDPCFEPSSSSSISKQNKSQGKSLPPRLVAWRLKKAEKKQEGEQGGPKLSWRTGRLKGWTRIDAVSEEVLKKDWRRHHTKNSETGATHMYYCPYGVRCDMCPAMLKTKVLNDGTVLFFKNAYEHANHRTSYETHGMSKEQKAFVMQCLEKGVTKPKLIMFKFETSDCPKPQLSQLKNLIARLKKCDETVKHLIKKEPSKWPRRVRKKKVSDGPPKKRGRPPKNVSVERESIIASSSSQSSQHQQQQSQTSPVIQERAPAAAPVPKTDSTSSIPPPTSSTSPDSFQPPHPNHYLGQLALNPSYYPATTFQPSNQFDNFH